MVVYKVYRGIIGSRKGSCWGTGRKKKGLERKSQLESGLRWAMLTFGQSLKDKRSSLSYERTGCGNGRKAHGKGNILHPGVSACGRSPCFYPRNRSHGRNLRAKRSGERAERFHLKNLPLMDWFYGFSERPFNVTPIRGFSI